MNKFFTSVLAILILNISYAQIGVGIEEPNKSSILDITSKNKGVLMPRLTTSQRNSIENPSDGLLVYDTDEGHFYHFSSRLTKWEKIYIDGTTKDLSSGILKNTKGNNPENPEEVKVKNVIFMIGDGMSYPQIYAGYKRAFDIGKPPFTLTTFPYTGIVTTYSADNFTTDSSAGATALGSGVKTNNGYVGIDPAKNHVKSILTEAKERGLSAGIVVTVTVTHATPASFYAHHDNRFKESVLAEYFTDSGIDVCIGAGGKYFPSALRKKIENKGYSITTGLENTLNSTSNKLLGFIYEDDLMPRVPIRGNVLAQTTKKALDILSENAKGFFLMVEGSQIDKGGHAKDAEWMMEEMIDFDEAIKVAKDFAEKDGNTLIIVTSDHETGGLFVYGKDALKTKYTGSINQVTGAHSAIPVPSFSYGPGAEEFTGYFDNTEFKEKLMKLYNFEN